MRKVLNSLIILIVLTITLPCVGFCTNIHYDTTSVVVKAPSHKSLQAYRDKKEFNYHMEKAHTESYANRFLEWLIKWLSKMFGNENYVKVVRWFIITALVVFLVLMLMNVKVLSLFYSNRKKGSVYLNSNEFELMLNDLDDLINKEINSGNYRKAVRYLYLKLLKTLNEKEYIILQMSKTINDYRKEMRQKPFINEFLELSSTFEFVYYGNHHIGQEHFSKVNSDFIAIFSKLDE